MMMAFLLYLSIIRSIVISMVEPCTIKASHNRHVSTRRHLRYIPLLLAVMVIYSLFLSIYASAKTSISQSYATTDKLSLGSIVSLKNNTTDQVVAASTYNIDSILGVVINNGSSILSLTNGQEDQVQVATSELASVLVSNINGDIVQGDQITASPIKGVGMRATNNTKVIGVAQDIPTNSNKQQFYTDSDGKKQSVVLGEVPILVNVSFFFKEPEKTLIPSALQNIANALAGKQVSTLPIVISATIFIITIIVVVSIVFAMVRSSIISVGRNPMSQSAIYRDLIQLSALVLAILSVGMIAIYLVLTKM